MPALHVVEAFDVVEHISLGLVARPICFARYALCFQRGEEAQCRYFHVTKIRLLPKGFFGPTWSLDLGDEFAVEVPEALKVALNIAGKIIIPVKEPDVPQDMNCFTIL